MENMNLNSVWIMILLSFVLTYVMTFAMMNEPNDFTFNLNLFYQASFMGLAMGAVEMGMMLSEHSTNFQKGLFVCLLLSSLFLLFLLRFQIGLDQKDFLQAMIPHHSMAIEMVQQIAPKTTDPKILVLMKNIVQSQKAEILLMQKWLHVNTLKESIK